MDALCLDDLRRTSGQLTALLDMVSCNISGFRLLDEAAQESLLCLADDLAYRVQAAIEADTCSHIAGHAGVRSAEVH